MNFGYAKLCIICIENRCPQDEQSICIRQCNNLIELLENQGSHYQINQNSILLRQEYTFPLMGVTSETKLIDTTSLRLGDIAECVTGIYSGADTQFLRRSAQNRQGIEKYPEITTDKICPKESFRPAFDGYEGEQCFVPLLKGGGYPYLKPELWFIDWSREAIHHYKTDKKSRFQNSRFYFRRGIGFPMVSSGRATATVILDSWLFDQSVVGIFPKEVETFGFLLAFLNSNVCWKLLRQINPSTNNSAKYLQRLPIILPSQETLKWFQQTVSFYLEELMQGCERNLQIEQDLEKKICEIYDPFLH